MLGSFPARVAAVRFGRWIVSAGVLVFVSALVVLPVFQHFSAYKTFMSALFASGLTMTVLGLGERFSANKKLQTAKLTPEGAEVGFAEPTQKALEELNARVTSQMEDVNKRLYDLEREVFKSDETG